MAIEPGEYVGYVNGAKRIRNSYCGNPQYRMNVTIDGLNFEIKTQKNSGVAHSGAFEFIGKAKITIGSRGTVCDVIPVS